MTWRAISGRPYWPVGQAWRAPARRTCTPGGVWRIWLATSSDAFNSRNRAQKACRNDGDVASNFCRAVTPGRTRRGPPLTGTTPSPAPAAAPRSRSGSRRRSAPPRARLAPRRTARRRRTAAAAATAAASRGLRRSASASGARLEPPRRPRRVPGGACQISLATSRDASSLMKPGFKTRWMTWRAVHSRPLSRGGRGRRRAPAGAGPVQGARLLLRSPAGPARHGPPRHRQPF